MLRRDVEIGDFEGLSVVFSWGIGGSVFLIKKWKNAWFFFTESTLFILDDENGGQMKEICICWHPQKAFFEYYEGYSRLFTFWEGGGAGAGTRIPGPHIRYNIQSYHAHNPLTGVGEFAKYTVRGIY